MNENSIAIEAVNANFHTAFFINDEGNIVLLQYENNEFYFCDVTCPDRKFQAGLFFSQSIELIFTLGFTPYARCKIDGKVRQIISSNSGEDMIDISK